VSPPDSRVELLERRIAFDGHFKIVRYRLRHELFHGGMGKELVREVFERGHAVAVLPYDPARDQVVLVEQFRIGALEIPGDPWLLEPVAGIIDEGETPVEVARREAIEEAGLELQDLTPACTYFVSPGGTSETCQVLIGRIEAPPAGGVHGLADEGEDIRVHVVPLDEALKGIDDGRIRVASTIVALQWLGLHRAEVRGRWATRSLEILESDGLRG
jgi:ADP-ribose pyrophosphatase